MTSLNIDTPKAFAPMLEPARYRGLYGGRGSGKSHFFGEMAIEQAILTPGRRMVCIREVQKSLRESSKRLIEDKIIALGLSHLFECLSDRINTPGGGVIIFQGMQDHTAESIKSLENFSCWVEEAQTLSARSLELLRPTIRGAGCELWFSWNPRNASDPVDKLLRSIPPPPDSIVLKVNHGDNPFFPSELADEMAFDKVHSPDRFSHTWDGFYEPQAIGALWSRQSIQDNRRDAYPDDLERILVAVDPAVSNTDRSDEHGIVVCGLDSSGHGYLLEDASLHGSPSQWATRAVAMFDKWSADAVTIEKNQGGDMCRHTLQTIRHSLPVIEVHATRGKHVRAEPISALYPVGRVSHVGSFPELEDQLCLFTSSGWEGDADKSPDRAEAMIWAFTELFPAMTTPRNVKPEYYNYGGGSQSGGWMG